MYDDKIDQDDNDDRGVEYTHYHYHYPRSRRSRPEWDCVQINNDYGHVSNADDDVKDNDDNIDDVVWTISEFALGEQGGEQGGRGDFKLQLCLFMIRIVANCGSDADNDNGDIDKDYDTGNSDDVKILMRTRCEQW